jgi:hypothetical protein
VVSCGSGAFESGPRQRTITIADAACRHSAASAQHNKKAPAGFAHFIASQHPTTWLETHVCKPIVFSLNGVQPPVAVKLFFLDLLYSKAGRSGIGSITDDDRHGPCFSPLRLIDGMRGCPAAGAVARDVGAAWAAAFSDAWQCVGVAGCARWAYHWFT